jgi:ElaB/YqjD/DUF883 family membrane-anchored ribosome-binding protein
MMSEKIDAKSPATSSSEASRMGAAEGADEGKAARGIRTAARKARKAARRAARAIEGKYEDLSARTQRSFDSGRHRALEAGDDFKSMIRAAPLTSVLIAAAAGLVLGMIVRRK